MQEMDNVIDASPLTYCHANFEVLHQWNFEKWRHKTTKKFLRITFWRRKHSHESSALSAPRKAGSLSSVGVFPDILKTLYMYSLINSNVPL